MNTDTVILILVALGQVINTVVSVLTHRKVGNHNAQSR